MGHKRKRKIRIHREGYGIIFTLSMLIFTFNVLMFLYVPHWVFAIGLILSAMLLIFVTYFFRNPTRVLEVGDENFLIAPADGRVVVIEPTVRMKLSLPLMRVSLNMLLLQQLLCSPCVSENVKYHR